MRWRQVILSINDAGGDGGDRLDFNEADHHIVFVIDRFDGYHGGHYLHHRDG
jgi:hypothetical protein